MALFSRKKHRRIAASSPQAGIGKQLLYGFITLFTVGVLGYGTWYLTRLSAVTIDQITVSGGETVSHALMEQKIADSLEGNYFFFIPKRFTFTYPESAIQAAAASVPRAKDVAVTREGTKLHVTFGEYTPYALWCADKISNTDCMFLSEDGYAFAKAPPLRGGALMRFTTETQTPERDTQPFTAEQLRNMYGFIDGLEKQFGFRVLAVTRSIDEDLFYHLGEGGTIYTTENADNETTFENLATVLKSDKFSHLTKDNFSYIDLRFGNRVFVNETETEKPTPIAQEHASTTTTSTTAVMKALVPESTATTSSETLPDEN
ncbi:hypothetical protein GW943_00060 [Candidatus Parcubacteria bacterium]|uniref:POTRA domain-containing protein n=1 Tax=Candidatus Kaiserbacteria bacterium CG10_big_fil_rev_8_21_14_0_10_47_16 TaxID=1974608 RepID=A0A2H0UES3_9BACT|nr:hypothetical protein [Candidatus Parcubacteria bacterium]PIR84891.1 MAG: hypothetical protein COU16_00310 [Candidatus Kaiserbacteria bacterium CG10_big_fil_rev_8_21_14_0_10_47_16]